MKARPLVSKAIVAAMLCGTALLAVVLINGALPVAGKDAGDMTNAGDMTAAGEAQQPRLLGSVVGGSVDRGAARVSAGTTASDAQSSQQGPEKGLAAKALDVARQGAGAAARRAEDVLTRVPCLKARGTATSPAALAHVAGKLGSGAAVTIVAFGSSSTQGYGASSAAHTYPSRLAEQLRRKYPATQINMINQGVGGQEVPQMLARLQTSVLDAHPDLVIWQFGTNAVVRGTDVSGTATLVEEGIARMQAAGADVVLVDPQYVPAVTAKKEGASRMVKLIGDIARLKKIAVFPRFEVMRHWHEDGKMPFETFVINDGLHMNDWGYACFAQLLGDTIIASVERAKTEPGMPGRGVPEHKPGYVMSYRPM